MINFTLPVDGLLQQSLKMTFDDLKTERCAWGKRLNVLS